MPALSAAGGGSGQLAQRASKAGSHPAALLETSHGAPSAVPPTACCTAVDSMPHHLRVQALEAAARRAGGARRARTRTSCRTSACESSFQRPPTSTARTKRRWPPPRSAALQFRIRCALVALGHAQGDAGSMVRSWVRGTRSGDGANQSGIATKGEALGRGAVHHEVEALAL